MESRGFRTMGVLACGIILGITMVAIPERVLAGPASAGPGTGGKTMASGTTTAATTREDAGKRAYRENRLPLQCFMKDLCDWTKEEMDAVDKAELMIESDWASEGDIKECDLVGKRLHDTYAGKIASLIARSGVITQTAIEMFPQKAVSSLDSRTTIIDIQYARNLGKGLSLVAFHLARAGKPEQAFALLNLVGRFGQIISSGDGMPPTMVQFMVGLSIQKRAWSKVCWGIMKQTAAIRSGRNWLTAWVPTFRKWMDAGLDLKQAMRVSDTNTINNIERFLFDPAMLADDGEESPVKKVLQSVPENERPAAIEKVKALFLETQKKLQEAFDRLEAKPLALRVELDRIMAGIAEKAALVKRTPGKDPAMDAAHLLLDMNQVDIEKLQAQWLETRYRRQGLAILTEMLSRLEPKTPLPATAKEWAAVRLPLPRDAFSEQGELCLLRQIGSETVLYSRGRDGADDGGNPEKDFILFSF